jgi:hypothetical protein
MKASDQTSGLGGNASSFAPKLLLALFGAVLLMEVFTFFVLAQWAPAIRFFLLAGLMFFTLRGSKAAKGVLVFLLFAGALLLIGSALASTAAPLFLLQFHYVPGAVLTTTALFLLFSKSARTLGRTSPNPAVNADAAR